MAEVLGVPRQPDGQSYYQQSTSPLRRSPPSSSSLFLDSAPLSTSPKDSDTPHAEYQERLPFSPPSNITLPAPAVSSFSDSISDDSTSTSTASSVTSDLTLETDITFPNYDGDGDFGMPPSSPAFCDVSNDERNESATTDTSISESPLPTPTVVDDTAVRQEPSRQVDFLSHDWREEDIWSSWRHIVSQRKTVYGERSRLENASWRTWAKAKFDLRTVSPERLNWLKESDVTWLYGPLKVASSYPVSEQHGSQPASQLSKNNSFINKKPILKKRSMSEVMLQKSLSTSSLVKQAAASVQAQGRQYRKSGPDVVDSKFQSETPSRDQVDYFTSRSSSSTGTPYEPPEKRHIRFDDRVEQCIAIDCKDVGIEDEEYESEPGNAEDEDEDDDAHPQGSDSSSDEGLVMRKRKKRTGPKKKKQGSRSNSANGRKIIETLPATTLKYRTDSPDVTEEAQHHTFGRSWNQGKLSPSLSQETLRPSSPSTNFLLPQDDDDGDNDVDSDSSWSFGPSNPKSSLGTSGSSTSRRDCASGSRARSSTPMPRASDYEVEGMRRTGSGMFMPYDEDEEDEAVAAGLFGRVSETINTARDIAHVIWNVGWRK